MPRAKVQPTNHNRRKPFIRFTREQVRRRCDQIGVCQLRYFEHAAVEIAAAAQILDRRQARGAYRHTNIADTKSSTMGITYDDGDIDALTRLDFGTDPGGRSIRITWQ